MQDAEDSRRMIAEANKQKFNLNRRSRFKPPVVKSKDDIKRVIEQLGIGVLGSNISALVEVQDENGKICKVTVNSNSPSKTKFAMLRDGLRIFKERKETGSTASVMTINNRQMKQPDVIGMPAASWVDSVVERWTGGKRDGHLIRWSFGNEKYYFDIFDMKLFTEE